MTNDGWGRAATRLASRPMPAGAGLASRPGPAGPGRRPSPGRPAQRPTVLVLTAALVMVGLAVAWTGQHAEAATRPTVAWVLSPASNTVTLRLAAGGGPVSGKIARHSRLAVSEGGQVRQARYGGTIRVHVPPGGQTQLVVRVKGPRPYRATLTVTVPPALRVTGTRHSSHGLLVSLSDALRRSPRRALCGENIVSFPASSQVAVARSPIVCRARLRVTAQDGEQAVVPVTVPALPEVPLYSFASPARRAIYITVDDGWTPSMPVLDLMRRTHLPVTAFLIEHAAQRNLPYWRAFVKAGGTVGDHTVSHPNLTKLTMGQATAQWAQARRVLGRWLGRAPLMGRPPYGAFDPAVEAAAYRGGLKKLVGWSATVDSDGIRTWDGKPLEPGEIVLLHWVPGLGHQLTKLLAAIHARHLNPVPLTPASFAGIVPQRQSLDGD
jgi:peptidoglycan/xylan/chitin deacetylase (PgdA/CDA1 family)